MKTELFIIDERLPSVSGHLTCIMLYASKDARHIPQLLISGSLMLSKFAELAEATASLHNLSNCISSWQW